MTALPIITRTVREGAITHPGPTTGPDSSLPPDGGVRAGRRVHVELTDTERRALTSWPVNVGRETPGLLTRIRHRLAGRPVQEALDAGRLPDDWTVATVDDCCYLELPAGEAGHVPAVLARFGGAA